MPAGNLKPSIHTQTAIFHCEECTRALFGLASNGHKADSFRIYKNFFSNVFISPVFFSLLLAAFHLCPLNMFNLFEGKRSSNLCVYRFTVQRIYRILFRFVVVAVVCFVHFLYSLSSLLQFMLAYGVLAMDLCPAQRLPCNCYMRLHRTIEAE